MDKQKATHHLNRAVAELKKAAETPEKAAILSLAECLKELLGGLTQPQHPPKG